MLKWIFILGLALGSEISTAQMTDKQLATYECGLHGRKVVEAWRRNHNIDVSMAVLKGQLTAQYGELQGQKVFAVYEAVTAETIAWTEAALARAFAGFTVAEQLPPQEARRFADRLKSNPTERDRWIERFFTNGWLTQPSSGYGKDYPEATWLYRMKAVQAVCAGAFVGAPDIVAGHQGLGYPPSPDHPRLQVPFPVQ
ncbi:hypothetical protein [Limnohabitans radicicola]|uniref:Uncharacterized protein n=1 Tax=Limnohabitans radicicola TaxID=2771427 RepID=A0A927IN99_9BURK|nr:hypothetical protein [Limnohabitans radicicola]MBD8051996.1 hypothetical protein [Limnohabitans radicicola]